MSKIQVKHGSNNEQSKNCQLLDLGKGFFTIVDCRLYDHLKQWRWYAKRSSHCYYAVRKTTRNGKEIIIRMHRQLMSCPLGMEVHHINQDSLDNRLENLIICTPQQHRDFHNLFIIWDTNKSPPICLQGPGLCSDQYFREENEGTPTEKFSIIGNNRKHTSIIKIRKQNKIPGGPGIFRGHVRVEGT